MARTIRINAQPNAIGGRFCRAGLCFGTVAQEYPEDAFTPEELERLKAEPMLVVEIEVRLEPKAKAEVNAKEGAKEEAKPTAAPQEDEAPAKSAAKEGGK